LTEDSGLVTARLHGFLGVERDFVYPSLEGEEARGIPGCVPRPSALRDERERFDFAARLVCPRQRRLEPAGGFEMVLLEGCCVAGVCLSPGLGLVSTAPGLPEAVEARFGWVGA
jgi:hypothetical protein